MTIKASADKAKKGKPKQSIFVRLITALITATLCITGAWLLSFFAFTSRAELMSLDLRYQTRKPIELYPNLGYVNLDTESCELAGDWPWPRSYHIALVKSLAFYGARAAGYDVFYVEPSPIEQRPSPNVEGLDQQEKKEAIDAMFLEHDERFEQALADSNIIYLGEFFTSPSQMGLGKSFKEEEFFKKLEELKTKFTPLKMEAIEEAKKDGFETNDKWNLYSERTLDILPPIPSLSKVSAGVGFEQIIPDNITGTVYEYPMFLEYDGHIFPALGLLIAADILGIDLSKAQFEPGESIEFEVTKPLGNIQKGKFKVPINAKMRTLMNWSAPYFDTYFHINFRQLSRYYAYNQIKDHLKSKFDNTDLETLYNRTLEWANAEHWVEETECELIIKECIAAQLIEGKSEASREEQRLMLSNEKLLSDIPLEKILDAVRLALTVQKNGNEEDKRSVAQNISSHDYLDFRPDLYQLEQYPNISAEHAKEIARNVLWFSHQNRLDEVSPLYFPPCEKSHVDGQIRDISPTMLAEKILMIGLEGEGTIDLNPQPYEESCAMVALHANAINSFLTGQFLEFPNEQDTIVHLLILSLIIAIVSQFMNTRWSFFTFLIILLTYLGYAWYQFSEHGQHMTVVVPCLGLMLSYFASVGLQLYIAFKEKQKMKGMFGKMVSPDVLKVMSDNPDLFSLTGRRQPCTSTFSSMENFAQIVKGVTPQEMTGLLSSYLTPASQIITSYKGYIDKYEGHIIMSDFGVPIATGDHRQQCLYASIEQQLDITAFKHHIYARTGKHVNTSIGVNTGFVSAGNMGSDKKMQYTIMGDTVNTAARFRPANWIYNYLGGVIIGESTYPLVKDIIQARPLDRLLLKGKLKPINIYQVMGWEPQHYLDTRGKDDVTETLQVCWADHCPPEKIYGYSLHWAEQYQRTQHPLCKELSEFFAAHIDLCAELARLTLYRESRDNGINYLSLQERFQSITSTDLSGIPTGEWKEKLHHWAEGTEKHLELLAHQFKGNPEADKLHHDLLDVFEKVEALSDRLELKIELPQALNKTWDQVRQYVGTNFQDDNTDFNELYDTLYAEYRTEARNLVASVSKRMSQYHEMMSLVGSMTEQQHRGCENYKKALALHWERKWEESIAMFQLVLQDLPNDKAATSFIDRIEAYKTAPPPDDWQGEFKQTKK